MSYRGPKGTYRGPKGTYRGPKGTYDVYPGGGQSQEPHERPELWAWVEGVARDFFRRYNYTEVRTPV
ncbi:MAG: hypothetical protein H0X71_06740, partial [Rubrobacter sp.]|nr:hypothetical protein [Rubrobacter sp.]